MAIDRDGNSDRVIVLIDTNAFLMAGQFTLDLYDEIRGLCGAYRPVVPDVVLTELAGLSRGRGKDGAAARFGMTLASKCEQVKTERNSSFEPEKKITPDDRIFTWAKENGAVVVTNDRFLRNRLLSEGLSVISLKGRQKLEMIQK